MISFKEIGLISNALQQALVVQCFQKKISYFTLSQKTGINVAVFKSIEQGKIDGLDFLSLFDIATAFDCHVSDLVDTQCLRLPKDAVTKRQNKMSADFDRRRQYYAEIRESISCNLQDISRDIRALRKRRFASCSLRDQLIHEYNKKRISLFSI